MHLLNEEPKTTDHFLYATGLHRLLDRKRFEILNGKTTENKEFKFIR
jgi:hypothetical protein